LWGARLPQEVNDPYYFSGQLIVTAGVSSEIPKTEIVAIHQDVQTFAKANGGADYKCISMRMAESFSSSTS